MDTLITPPQFWLTDLKILLIEAYNEAALEEPERTPHYDFRRFVSQNSLPNRQS
jgi:hypothetical protein